MADSGIATAAYWLPLGTAFLGFASGVFSEWFRDRRAYRREREARESLRREQLLERRASFQRETLLELQDAVARLIRTTSEMHHCDLMVIKSGGAWHKQLYPDDLDKRAHLANTQTTLLGVRVTDKCVRIMLGELKSQCVSVLFSRNSEQSEQLVNASGLTYIKLNDRIGEVIRSLDDAEV